MESSEKYLADFLSSIGIDLRRLGMDKTPERVTKMYKFLFSGLDREITSADWGDLFSSESHGLVAVKHLPFYSMCEHHLVPFFGEVNIVYQPRMGKVAGFSKFTKVVEILSHRPQLQERLTCQIAEAVENGLNAEGVLVTVEATQLCMMMRGDLAPAAKTITSESRGIFRHDSIMYQQAWQLLSEDIA